MSNGSLLDLSLSWLGCTTLFEHEPLLTDKHEAANSWKLCEMK